MSSILHTKFGNASLNPQGHYRITSRKEGNHSKLLHRLIWEDFYNCEIPDGYVIHHKNGIKTDNCILNLQLMKSEAHRRYHTLGKDNANEKNPMFGRTHTEDSKIKMGLAKSSTGIFRVHKRNDPRTIQGYSWSYEYKSENKRKVFVSVSLKRLKEKVLDKGYDWIILDENKVKAICNAENIDYGDIL